MVLFDLDTCRAFPATRGRFMQSPLRGLRLEPATLWTTNLRYHLLAIGTRVKVQADGTDQILRFTRAIIEGILLYLESLKAVTLK